jgi:hypothetical protein
LRYGIKRGRTKNMTEKEDFEERYDFEWVKEKITKGKIIWFKTYYKGRRSYRIEEYHGGIFLIVSFPKSVDWWIIFPYSFLPRLLFIWRIHYFGENKFKEFSFYEKDFWEICDDEEVRKGLEVAGKIVNKIINKKKGYKKAIEDFIKFLKQKGEELMKKFPVVEKPVIYIDESKIYKGILHELKDRIWIPEKEVEKI